MQFIDLIEKKKAAGELTADELGWIVDAYLADEVPDYQMAAFLMAVRWRGLSDAETAALTRAMVESGDTFPRDAHPGRQVDKHSTGGVGDKVSLVLAPLAAACGCVVPMISGRGLGHTGGTLDKLESIPGFRTDLDAGTFQRLLDDVGVAMAAQTESLVPADRRLYALRSATGTVDDTGLITASILSKKIAEGAAALVLDVKVGSGAFLPDLDAARGLADRLRRVAGRSGLPCSTLLTDMDQPLGRAVGNALEVEEAVAALRGAGPDDLVELTVELVVEMLVVVGLADGRKPARTVVERALEGGEALEVFRRMVEAQGGDPRVADDPGKLPRAPDSLSMKAPRSGFVHRIDARRCGRAALTLGAGRPTRDAEIDPAAGLSLLVKRGEHIETDEPWITLHHGPHADVESAREHLEAALEIADDPPDPRPLLLERRT